MTGPRDRAAAIARHYGLTAPYSVDAVVDAYQAVAAASGPFLTTVAADLLTDLQHDVDAQPHRMVVFLGRDGLPLAAAARALDPVFSDRHTRTITLSRTVLEHALRDLEENRGRPLALPPVFRVDAPGGLPGAYRILTRYLRDQDVPVDHENTTGTIVDTSYKGTAQEMLAAVYPRTEFTGRYLAFGAHPLDPHPGTQVRPAGSPRP